ncbi:MAG: site-2 protease family protein [bacterium]|nr:site-2 protease family protein [bacterium]
MWANTMQDAQFIQVLFSVLVLVFSVVAHEVSHGYMAQYLGDPTARLAGRLTMNPIRHIDPIGSLLVPFVTALLPGGIIFGWAKPVPYNPYNLRDQKWGDAKVALAGPLTNLGIAIIFAVLLRFGGEAIAPPMVSIMHLIVLINVILAVFNLVPIPPLDGSKVLFNLLPLRYRYVGEYLERYALALILVFAFFLWKFFLPLIYFLYLLLVGTSV